MFDDYVTAEVVGVRVRPACEEKDLIPVDHAAIILKDSSPFMATDLLDREKIHGLGGHPEYPR